MEPSSKRILLLLPEVFGCEGGIQMFCRALCLAAGRWAKAHKAEVAAIVLNDNCEPDARYVNGGFNAYVTANKSKAKFVASYVQQLFTHHPDVVIFGHLSLSPLALIPELHKAKSCVITYGIEAWEPLPFAGTRALQKAEAVLAISDYTKAELVRHNHLNADKVKLFPCSLDPYWTADGAVSPAPSQPPVMLTVCRLKKEDEYKGVDTVIRSLPAVVREFGGIDYRVVGQGDDVPRLQALAESLGVARYVTFTGRLSDEELCEQYRQCSLFVMPSEKEGFGIVFLEAMAYAKPVIGGAHGGTPSVIQHGETGLLVHRANAEELAQAILRILQNDELRLRLGHSGHQRLLKEFTFPRFQANLDTVLSAFL